MSSMIYTVANVLVKDLSHVDLFMITCIRYYVMVMLASPVVMKRIEIEHPFPVGKRRLLIWRGIIAASYMMINYYAIQHLPLGNCMMIIASSPMFTTIYARFFLKEPIVPSDILNLFLVFAGIIFIVKPPFIFGYSKMYNEDPEALYAIIALLFGNVFLWAPTFIILRKLKEVHWSVNLSIYGCIGFIECLIAVLIFTPLCLPESGLERFYLILIGILSLFAQMTFVIACKFENAATVCLLRNAFNVIFAFIFQIVVFQQIPGYFSITGAALISLAVIISGLTKIIDNLPPTHWMKKIELSKLTTKEMRPRGFTWPS